MFSVNYGAIEPVINTMYSVELQYGLLVCVTELEVLGLESNKTKSPSLKQFEM